jgi:arginyl-tRNA synthetase
VNTWAHRHHYFVLYLIPSQFPYSCLIESPKIPIYSSSSLLFIFKPVPLSNILIPSILAEKVIWGYNSSLGLKDTQDNSKSRKRIIIHSSVAQVSQSSHLRSIILGNFFANLYEKSGWDVVRLKDASERWGKRYEETYARFNFRFDDEHRPTESSVRDILQLLQSKNFATLEMDGALTIDFSVHVPGRVGKELEKSVLRSSDGTNTRLLNDLAALLERHQSYRFEKMLYVAGKDQDLHYKQLLKLVELLRYEELRSRVSHVNFGPVLGLENFSSFDEIMDDITQNLHDNLKKEEAKHSNLSEQDRIVEKLATSAILIQDLSARR